MDPQLANLARRLQKLERGQLLRKQPQLAFSSIEDGALKATDVDGNVTMLIGKQYDSTSTSVVISGPTPPTPTAPLVTSSTSGLRVYWDGTFADALVAPMDWARTTVHAYPLANFSSFDPTDQSRIVGSFTSATGGEALVGLPEEEHLVFLVAWSQAGKFSPASTPAAGTPSTIPIYEPPALTPPPSTPALVSVTGLPSSLVLVTEPIRPEDEIEVHLSTDPDFTVVPGDPATLVVPSTKATVVNVAALPNGNPLDPEATYYLRVLARNAAGSAPSASAAVSGKCDPSAVAALVTASIVAGFALLGELTVGNISIHPETGITIRQPNGNVIRFPAKDTEFAEITGHLTAQTLAVVGNMSVDAPMQINNVATIGQGVTAPRTRPTNSNFWPSVKTGLGGTYGDIYYGLTNRIVDANGTLHSTDLVTAIAFYGGSVRTVNKSTGAIFGFYNVDTWGPDFNPSGGVVSIGGFYYLLGQDATRNYSWYIYKLDHTFTKVAEYAYTTGFAFDGRPAIGRDDAGRPVIAFVPNGSKNLSISTRDPSTLGPVPGAQFTVINAAANPTGASVGLNLTGVHIGKADLGAGAADRVWVSVQSTKIAYAYTINASAQLVRDQGYDFYTANAATKGMCFDRQDPLYGAGRFRSLDTTQTLHHYSGFRQVTAIRSRSTAVDLDTGGTGQHETAPSPYSLTHNVLARAWLRVQASPAPDAANEDPTKLDKANQVRVYVAVNPNEPTLQATLPVKQNVADVDSLGVGPVAPAISTDFSSAGTTAGSVATDGTGGDGKPTVAITGKGGGNVGQLVWADDGTPLPPQAGWATPALTSPYTAVTGREPRYTRDGAGNVHIRGRVNRNAAADGALVFVLPPGFRPTGVDWRVVIDTTPRLSSSGVLLVSANGEVRLYVKTGTPTDYYIDCSFSIF